MPEGDNSPREEAEKRQRTKAGLDADSGNSPGFGHSPGRKVFARTPEEKNPDMSIFHFSTKIESGTKSNLENLGPHEDFKTLY